MQILGYSTELYRQSRPPGLTGGVGLLSSEPEDVTESIGPTRKVAVR